MPNTPNMRLQQPTAGVDSGATWEIAVNNNANIIDQHNHTAGNGVPIPATGININSALPFNNNPATALQSIVFTAQPSLTTVQAVYVIGNDLYYNDGAGNVVQITSGGTVNATSSGISSGTASAAFSAGVLVVVSAPTVPANVQMGSALLGNNTASSKFLTLSPPAAMAANFQLTLPAIPAASSFLTIDTSGNLTGSIATTAGITASNIAAATITGSKIASATVTGSNIASATVTSTNMAANSIVTTAITDANVTRAKQAAVGQQVSSSSGTANTASASFTSVTNLNVTITTTGRPVVLLLQPDGGATQSDVAITAPGVAQIQILRGATSLGIWALATTVAPLSTVFQIDTPAAGTYTYTVQYRITSATNIQINHAVLMAYEL